MGVFVRMTKLKNIVGRQEYIFAKNDEEKKETIVASYGSDVDYLPFAEYEDFISEKQNQKINQGRELIIALPDYYKSFEADELKKELLELSKKILGENDKFCFAVHKENKNLHMHLIFPERLIVRDLDLELKKYKRDVWIKKDGTLAKSKEERFKKIHSKGDIKNDYEYEFVYPFSNKIQEYKTKKFLSDTKKLVKEHFLSREIVLKENRLRQIHTQNYWSKDKIKKVREYNSKIQRLNSAYRKLLKKGVPIENLEKLIYRARTKDFKFDTAQIMSDFNSIEAPIIDISPQIKFWTTDIDFYERKNFITKEKENMYRIKFPKESEYSDYFLETKLSPNPVGEISYITLDKDFQYKLIAPAKDGEKLDWTKKDIKKISGYEIIKEFGKSKEVIENYRKNQDILKRFDEEKKEFPPDNRGFSR